MQRHDPSEFGDPVKKDAEDDHGSLEDDVQEVLFGEGGGEEEDLLISLQEATSAPPSCRDPNAPIRPEEYVATVILRTACLSIDRRPNNKGIELVVSSEEMDVKDEMGRSGVMGHESAKVSKVGKDGITRSSQCTQLWPLLNVSPRSCFHQLM